VTPALAPANAATGGAMTMPMSATDESKIPHYFGPYSNWANSPQVLSDAVVSITGTGTGAEAAAVVDPKTGGIASVDVTVPGTGYDPLNPPAVQITSMGGQSSAVAQAVVSAGALTSIAVNESGFGFTAPAVALTGGNPTPGKEATTEVSGGVDNLTLARGGFGYGTKPLVTIDKPNAAYCAAPPVAPALVTCAPATATATMDSNGVVTGITLVDPGEGYTTAPGVTITDVNTPQAVPAVVDATIGIGRIDVTNGGQGYDSAPTVTITDVGGVDKGASATATVATKGAVTAIKVTAPGSGYLTPGIKKFVDTLAGLGPNAANNLHNYIPVAVPDTTTYPGTDYYEIAVVQYYHQFSSDLPPTLERGYVQLSTSVVPGGKVKLYNALLNDPGLAANPPAPGDGTPIMGAGGDPNVQYTGVDKPRYLGPTIVASKDKPVRILFRNLLPTGVDGNLFLPVDTSIMGAGPGPDAMKLGANDVPVDMAKDQGTVTDGVRNPMCAQADPITMEKPKTCYAENRATLHLHGGITPWISDGTPHQWTTPAGQSTNYPKGVSVSNVPDMPDPGPGAETFFYTNQQSARLMFYHDHAWGITRLNVYAGEAAGYVLTDKMEQSLIAPGGALDGLGVGTPLVIQDKTFVPKNIHATDPTWDTSTWGGEGSLWTPHVYMPAQNPGSPTGQSSFGRWMYGPWFWPPAKDAKYPPIANPYYQSCVRGTVGCTVPESKDCNQAVDGFCEPAQIPSTPNVSVGMEAFNDTPLVNGTAYPTTTVDPKAYRYRILNAANDRFWNLQWYVADPTTGTLSEVALKPAEVAAAQTDPNVFPTPDLTKSPEGPKFVQIGTEGGFLPTPTVVDNQPMTWITDPTRFDFGNADKHALLLAPAERADVIVDFSAYRGKTLILYNDAPAAFPARQANMDYYTGGPDMRGNGGAPTTLPGYGPNTRTIMQVKVSMGAKAIAWDRPNTTTDRMGDLMAAFAHHNGATTDDTTGITTPAKGVFESGSDPIVVGQSAYNTAYGTKFSATGNCTNTTTGPATCDGFARIQQQGNVDQSKADKFTFNTLADALVTDANGATTTPTAPLRIGLQPKALHDEMNSANFDEWGRMTANLGLEAPGATPLLQNIILYPYVNPSTENLDATGLPSSLDVTPISSAADGTQIWKITHNGVDTHPIHFHLYDVQVINRVTWDNIIMPPDPNELGWKDTVRLSPLEDTYVAVRPIVPTLPFGLLDSKRLLNPMMPEHAKGSANGPNGTEAGFNNTDPSGNPIAPVSNEMTNFGWEYVYHCHILSHEEMDMMRPVSVHVDRALPDASALTYDPATDALGWNDPTPVDYLKPATWANVQNEVGYRIERATEVDLNVEPAAQDFKLLGTALANATTYSDAVRDHVPSYWYRLISYNAAGDTASAAIRVEGLPAPSNLVANVVLDSTQAAGARVDLTWDNNATSATSAVLERAGSDGVYAPVTGTIPFAPGAVSFSDPNLLPGAYTYRVKSLNGVGSSAYAGPVSAMIAKVASTVTVTSSKNPSTYGDSVTFTATVGHLGATTVPTGTVTFTAAAGTPVSVAVDASGVATYTTAGIVVSAATVTAGYSGDGIYNASTGSIVQTIQLVPTTTTVTSSQPVSSQFGAPVTFTAAVAQNPGAGVPTGSVSFYDGSVAAVNLLGTGTLSASAASISTSVLPVGARTVLAVYSGDAINSSSTGSLTQTVVAAPSSTVVTSSLNPSVYGGSVTFSATVTTTVGNLARVVTGQVQFSVDGAAVGSPVSLANGVAALAISTLTAGSHTVVADYLGNPTDAPSTSAGLTQVVDKAPSAVSVTQDLASTVYGSMVTYTATVSSPGATGTVSFYDGATLLGGPVVMAGGLASLGVDAQLVGTRSVTAVYSGDTNYMAQTSAAVSHVVTAVPTSMVAISTPAPSGLGQAVRFDVTVSPSTVSATLPSASTSSITGIVDFTVGGTSIGSANVDSSGVASFITTTLAFGTKDVIATYSGDATFGGSATTVSQTVSAIPASVVLVSSSATSPFGSSVTFTATVTPQFSAIAPTGTVTITDTTDGVLYSGPFTSSAGAAAVATFSTTSLSLGGHVITAAYGGDTTTSPSTLLFPINHTVVPEPTTTLLSSTAPSVFGSMVTFTASVTPTVVDPLNAGRKVNGNVEFVIDGAVAGTAALVNGQTTYQTAALGGGNHTVLARYLGFGPDVASSSAALTQVVAKAPSSVTLTQSSTSRYYQPVTFTAQVTPAIATGRVQFVVDGVVLAPVALVGGRATLVAITLAVGNHTASVTYLGSSNYLTSTSATLTHSVIRSATRVTLVSNRNPSTLGTRVTFTATVSPVAPGAGAPTGTVRFRVDGRNVGTVITLVPDVNTGVPTAKYQISNLSVGRHTISVTYNGSANYSTSTSANLSQRIV
jgi:FtsP/CotA-like multicopper oxidase with cupredoxin domain